MAPHRFHRKPNRQRANTKTMNQMIVDIMELENDESGYNKCNENPMGASTVQRSSTSVTVMGDRNGNYRILDPNTGHLLPTGQNSRVSRESTRSHRPKGYDNRKKKDDHNVIERKRRNNINNLIKELRALLPQTINETSKGSTLKATVDYMKELKRERDRLKVFETAHKTCDRPDQDLLLRIQELESLVEAQNREAAASASRMNPSDQSQTSLMNPTTQDDGDGSGEEFAMVDTDSFTDSQVKQELEQQYLQQTYMPYTHYLNATDQGESDMSNVVLSEEELANILCEMSPLDQMVSAMPDPLAAYFDMNLAEASGMTITQLL